VSRRTEAQIALLIVGLIVWGYGARTDQPRLTWIGLACFAAATALRFARRRTQP
jgi:hypothetical protein